MTTAPKNNNLPKKILVIDDDSTVGQGLEIPLNPYEIRITNVQDLDAAIQHFNEETFPIVLVELEYESLHGLALIQRWRTHEDPAKRATGFILMTGKVRGAGDDNLVRELSDIESIIKPIKPVHLLPYISRAYAKHHQLLQFQMFRTSILTEFHASGKWEELAESIKKKIPEYGVRCIELLVELYELAGALEQALQFVNGMLAKDPASPMYLTAKGRLLMRLGRMQDAREPIEKAYSTAPAHLERLSAMEDLYLQLKEPNLALQKMEERLKLYKGNSTEKFGMAGKLQVAGEDELARKFVRSHANPMEVVRFYNNKGVAMAQAGQFVEAIVEYERALSYFPNSKENYRIHYNIALARIKSKNHADCLAALDNLKKCLELSPTFDKAKNTLEIIQSSLKKEAS